MRRRLSWPLLLAVLLSVGVLVPTVFIPLARGAVTVSFQDLEESLTCQCGCGLTVHGCNHLQCGSALPLRQEIRDQMALGKSKEQILAYFKDKYGEKILSAPTTSGFNLVAWITPFALVALGGVFVAVTLMRWSGRGGPATGTPTPAHVASPYDKVLEKELKDFDA
ncbi:MAG TPA: cytochrome c-type biogenesis protein CcmH [Candidatus Acidoferrales bacterium]|nr:cytochrome c-type biogenesis protein CcmH [Candidatus Acidoferrales bacterium]